ncbi:MAG: potassium channel protein [Dehalococcoidia bacterium]|nr:potassium channel protein [Dehalococcoidia bacterium]
MLMTRERRQEAYLTVERFTEVPMLVLSALLVPLLLAPLLFDLSPGLDDALFVLDWAIWGVFALELGVKTYLSPQRLPYLRQHWFDLLIVVLPFLRPLRVVRSARALRVFRALRLVSVVARVTHSTRAVLAGHGLQYILLIGLILLLACAGLVMLFERDSGGTIDGYDEALWWAITTITTVGYGDRYPITAEGRGIAAFLMLLGISLFSLLTANIAAFLAQPEQNGQTASMDDLLESIKRLEAKVDELQRATAEPAPAEAPLGRN